MKNFKGLQYGDYLIEEYIGKSTWRAKCQKCGLERTYKTANIKPEREPWISLLRTQVTEEILKLTSLAANR